MIVSYKNFNINVELCSDFNSDKNSILFLHGFTGSANDWKDIALKLNPEFNRITMDLLGHGKSTSPDDLKYYKSDELAMQILTVIEHLKIESVIICGYSMGGRAALSFASVYPKKVSALILESTSPGIENKAEREARIENDIKLTEHIQSHSMEQFINKWLKMEIFKSLKSLSKEKLKNLKKSKLLNSKTGLINSLKGFGTGVMPYLGNKIKKMKFPVLLITGDLDSKFTRINIMMVKKFPFGKHIIIENAGHNVHLENPSKFISVVNQFLQTI